MYSESVNLNRLCLQSTTRLWKQSEYSRYGNVFAEAEFNLVELSDKHGADGHEQRRAVHVDGGPDREHKLGYPRVHFALVVHTPEGDG